MPFSSKEIAEAYEADKNRYGEMLEQAAVQDGAQVTPKEPYKLHDHHLVPNQVKAEAARHGIDNDQYTVTVDADGHLGTLHAHDPETNSRNPEFMKLAQTAEAENREVTREEFLGVLKDVVEQRGLQHYDVHPYRNDAVVTSLNDLYVSEPPPPAPEAMKPAEPAPEAVKPPEPTPPEAPAPTDSDKR